MSLGPVELLVVKFPGNQFTGEIAPALKELVERDIVRVIDLVFVHKDQDGTLTTVEIGDLDDADYAAYDPVVSEVTGLLSDDDIVQLAQGLENNSSEALLLFENVWATRFRDAVAKAKLLGG